MTTSRCTPTLPFSDRFSARLDTEWHSLRTSRRSIRQARSWAADDPSHPLSRIVTLSDDLDDVIRATQRGVMPAGSDDEVMLRLVELARDDELAGRLVIQRLLPGLISQSVPYRAYHDDVDPVGLAVSCAWLALRSYDCERRRRHVAASLLSDAIFRAFRQPLRRRSSTEVARPPRVFLALPREDDARTAMEELAEVVRHARFAGVPTPDLELIRELARAESPALVARDRNVSARTVRNHRDRAVARVRAAVAA